MLKHLPIHEITVVTKSTGNFMGEMKKKKKTNESKKLKGKNETEKKNKTQLYNNRGTTNKMVHAQTRARRTKCNVIELTGFFFVLLLLSLNLNGTSFFVPLSPFDYLT